MAKKTTRHECIYCGEMYRKQDYTVCPRCGGDGGSITQKTWRPSKKERKEFAKKMNNHLLN